MKFTLMLTFVLWDVEAGTQYVEIGKNELKTPLAETRICIEHFV